MKIGKYVGGHCLVKVRFRLQVAEGRRLWELRKISSKDEYKDTWIGKDLNEEDRARINKLWEEMRLKRCRGFGEGS